MSEEIQAGDMLKFNCGGQYHRGVIVRTQKGLQMVMFTSDFTLQPTDITGKSPKELEGMVRDYVDDIEKVEWDYSEVEDDE